MELEFIQEYINRYKYIFDDFVSFTNLKIKWSEIK